MKRRIALRSGSRLLIVGVFLIWCVLGKRASAEDSNSFTFESLKSLDEMSDFIRTNFPLYTDRTSVRRTFVNEGRATLKIHPTQEGVEKYIYDINLCKYYIWRWNISVDFDAQGRLLQAYVNAVPVFAGGKPPRDPLKGLAPNQKAAIYRMQRPRPEANKGESSLGFILLDGGANPKTTDDQVFMGGAPTRADPLNMGTLKVVKGDPWRSIFDFDAANFIASYSGDCDAVDKKMQERRK
jgi:hypothetical protein